MYITTWSVFQNQVTYICRQSYTTVPERYLTRCSLQCSDKLVCFTNGMLESCISFGKVSKGKYSSLGTSVLHRYIAHSFHAVAIVGHLCDFKCSKV